MSNVSSDGMGWQIASLRLAYYPSKKEEILQYPPFPFVPIDSLFLRLQQSLFMDESNGNGVYASKSNNSAAASATTQATNNINNIMNAATAAAAAAATTTTTMASATALPTSLSSEDLSQSLSEYTDADESISAPTEFLAEFLSAVMLKDYKKALKYCKLILQYEPNNATAKEFYPLIQEKLKGAAAVAANSDSDENDNKSSSPEMGLELQPSTEPSAGESDEASDDPHAGLGIGLGLDNDEFGCEDNSSGGGSSSGMVEESISEDEDEDGEDVEDGDDEEDDVEVEEEDDVDDEIEDDDDEDDDDVEDVNSSSGDDLPIDGNHLGGDGAGVGHAGNDSSSSRHSSSGGEGRSRSDNTTHSYSSLLLEEEEADDLVPANLNFCKDLPSPDLDVSNGNKVNSTSCSDSESPTEPLTQRLAAILRSKCGVNSDGDNY